MCDCIKTANTLLAERNTRLRETIVFGTDKNPGFVCVTIMTDRLEPARGKGKAVSLMPNYCPFCGEKYPARSTEPDGREGLVL